MMPRIDPADVFGDPGVHASDPEPSLDELFRDPVFLGLLRSDGVSRAEILSLAALTRGRRGATPRTGRDM